MVDNGCGARETHGFGSTTEEVRPRLLAAPSKSPVFNVSMYLSVGVLLFIAVFPVAAFELITFEEAALPAARFLTPKLRGSPTRRPQVIVVWPSPGAALIQSPFPLKLQFRAYGGTEIDPQSVIVTYLKQPAIDITQRLMPFITPNGV